MSDSAITMKSLTSVVLIVVVLSMTAPGQEERESVLLPPSEANSVTRLCSRGGPGKVDGSWQPTKAELEVMESRLPQISRLKSGGGLVGLRIRHPNHYYRQYVAIVVGGRNFIYINGICQEKLPSNWHEHLVDVCDGGCNWGVLYDPASGKFSDLQTNGIA